MVLTFFVFNYALGVHPSGAHAYFPWLMSGMIGWNFFSGTLISGVSTFRSYSYLLNRWEFNMAVLPIVKIISGLFIHLIFVVLVILLLVVSHEHLHWAILQLPYYIFCASALLLGMIWMTASIHLFFRDISNLIGVLLQFGFWASPIFWELSKIPGSLRPFIKLNPMYYLITGYRETLLDGVPFWTHPIEGLYFWFVVSLFLWIGYFSYQRLRPDFGDLV
jgi:ABC-type polysaccharide/polyol phosphate export permease